MLIHALEDRKELVRKLVKHLIAYKQASKKCEEGKRVSASILYAGACASMEVAAKLAAEPLRKPPAPRVP